MAVSLLCGCDGNCWPPGNGNVRTIHAVRAGNGYAGPDDAIINFGEEPPTAEQIETMAKLVSILCEGLGHKQGQRADTLRNCPGRPLRTRQRGSVFQMGSVVPAGLYPRRGIDSRRRAVAGEGAVLPA